MDVTGLNPPQREAVEISGGPLLVVAGAGSGKTRVITHRIAHLLAAGIPPTAICALTFTNKAAAEMRARIAALIGDPAAAKKLTIGTFHALGLTILKAEKKALGLSRGFTIYDTADQLGVIRELLRKIATDRRYDVRAILARISLAKNTFAAPGHIPNPSDEGPGSSPTGEYDLITAEVYPRYQEALAAYAAFDFDDLICAPLALFDRDPEASARWRRRFHHVLVDEFQDTNRAQLAFVRHLVADHDNLFAVGDADQSIYRWRGADPKNIDLLEKAFPALRVVVLDQNYRSTPTILAGANAVIAHNTHRREKNLWSDRAPGEPITVAVAADPGAEAQFVAAEIEALVADGRRRSDIAVLYRSNR
ncbi:MAG TPA: UvrD-helicase domain-containing protein, partial [Kofleriaceae bacterium]|nr:UvrD-helicase domain-containing protein [Kofleriaceae bacterium]